MNSNKIYRRGRIGKSRTEHHGKAKQNKAGQSATSEVGRLLQKRARQSKLGLGTVWLRQCEGGRGEGGE